VSDLLYLDTARLGQISPSARRALNDITRFNADFGASILFNDLLYGGVQSLPDRLQRRYQNLGTWAGLGDFRKQVNNFVGVDRTQCLFSSRTKELMRFSAKLMFSRCRRVMISDLTWPPYQNILTEEAKRRNAELKVVSLEKRILSRCVDSESVAETIASEYCRLNCDGLFLPAISHLGIKLPIEMIAKKIRGRAELRFFVIDASQAAGQISLERSVKQSDFTFFGTHKWMRSFTPLGIAAIAREESQPFVLESAKRWVKEGAIVDPLWRFIDCDQTDRFGETVNLTPIFAAAGAIHDSEIVSSPPLNVSSKTITALCNGWEQIPISAKLQSQIVLLQREGEARDKEKLRRQFAKKGVSLTTYDCGKCRLSIPLEGLNEHSFQTLRQALASI